MNWKRPVLERVEPLLQALKEPPADHPVNLRVLPKSSLQRYSLPSTRGAPLSLFLWSKGELKERRDDRRRGKRSSRRQLFNSEIHHNILPRLSRRLEVRVKE